MDAEHRHELHSNDLVKLIQNFPEAVKDNIWMVVGVCLIIAAVLTYGPVRGYMKARKEVGYSATTTEIRQLDMAKTNVAKTLQADPTATDTSLIVAANTLEVAAGKASKGELSAMAYLKRAEALRSALHYSSDDTEKDIAAGEIEKARASYNKALAVAGRDVNLAAKAEFGLGLCAEEVADYATSEEIYNKIIANDAYQATIYPTQAQERLEKFEENKQKFVFADVPEVGQTMQGEPVMGSIEVVDPAVATKEVIIEPEAPAQK